MMLYFPAAMRMWAQRPTFAREGTRIWIVSEREFPISTSMAGALVDLDIDSPFGRHALTHGERHHEHH